MANLNEFHRRFVEQRIEGTDENFRTKRESTSSTRSLSMSASSQKPSARPPPGPRSRQPQADQPNEELDAWRALDEGIGNPGGGTWLPAGARAQGAAGLLRTAWDQ